MKEKVATHVLVCWDHRYAHDTVRQHNQILLEHDYVWWAKFYAERGEGNTLKPLEYREGPLEREKEFVKTLNGQINSGVVTRLYVCNPDPEFFSLHVGEILSVKFYEHGGEPSHDPDWLNLTPDYYFKRGTKGSGNLSFQCRYWFKVRGHRFYRELVLLRKQDLRSLRDVSMSGSGREITFSLPNFYPMPVVSDDDQELFTLSRGQRKQDGSRIFDTSLDFSSIRDSDFRKQVRDYWVEACNFWVDGRYEQVVNNCGRILECVLKDVLARDQARAVDYYKQLPEGRQNPGWLIDRWSLYTLITVAAAMEILRPEAARRAHDIRKARRIVAHPQPQQRLDQDHAQDAGDNLIYVYEETIKNL